MVKNLEKLGRVPKFKSGNHGNYNGKCSRNQVGFLDTTQNPYWKNQNKDHVIKFKIGTYSLCNTIRRYTI